MARFLCFAFRDRHTVAHSCTNTVYYWKNRCLFRLLCYDIQTITNLVSGLARNNHGHSRHNHDSYQFYRIFNPLQQRQDPPKKIHAVSFHVFRISGRDVLFLSVKHKQTGKHLFLIIRDMHLSFFRHKQFPFCKNKLLHFQLSTDSLTRN